MEYQPASRFFYVSAEWAKLNNRRVKEYGKNYLPFFWECDQALLYLYANCLDDIENAKITVNEIELKEDGECTKKSEKQYQKQDIAQYVKQEKQSIP